MLDTPCATKTYNARGFRVQILARPVVLLIKRIFSLAVKCCVVHVLRLKNAIVSVRVVCFTEKTIEPRACY